MRSFLAQGEGFEVRLKVRDPNPLHAYHCAHLHAACFASRKQQPAWVVSNGTESRRHGFPSAHAFFPGSILCKIRNLGLRSYFDFKTCSWLPLREMAEAYEARVPYSRRLLYRP